MVINKFFSYAYVVVRLPTIIYVSSGEGGRLWQVFFHALTAVKLLAEKFVMVILEVSC